MSFFKENNLEIEFFDYKKESVPSTLIASWAKEIDIDILLNAKGAKYRTLGLKELSLSTEEKISWLVKEPMLFKRPIVQNENSLLVAFNEEAYKKAFL